MSTKKHITVKTADFRDLMNAAIANGHQNHPAFETIVFNARPSIIPTEHMMIEPKHVKSALDAIGVNCSWRDRIERLFQLQTDFDFRETALSVDTEHKLPIGIVVGFEHGLFRAGQSLFVHHGWKMVTEFHTELKRTFIRFERNHE